MTDYPRSAVPSADDPNKWRSTTILGVRKGGKVIIAGDGQVSLLEIGQYLQEAVPRETSPHSQIPLAVGNPAKISFPVPHRSRWCSRNSS